MPGQRGLSLIIFMFCLALVAGILAWAWQMGNQGLNPQLSMRNLAPSPAHPFGTDWLGRDMLTRTLKGLCISLGIGMSAAIFSSVIAITLGIAAGIMGKTMDRIVTGLIDVIMSAPHLVLLILISFSLGGGAKGVIISIALTHWTRLARIIRAEVIQLRWAEYIRISPRLGRSKPWIIRHHMLPAIVPQFMVGLLLTFPHAILHAAGLTFLGFGLSPHTPAIGILLTEAMRHLSTGHWWLAVAPGLSLVAMVQLFDLMGNRLRMLTEPKSSQD
ncbi:ABC transporter permease [Desulfospira joergensenii]|uniref:ABC transporter permease n=1 Tax=Desulfospira joergensenii TaxID=53329 RepID=UPI001ABF19EF|nr:ABC transporter permease [Desulfospira joergensenii]